MLVAGHAAFKSNVAGVPADIDSDDAWVLQPFQVGEPPFYVEHIRRGVVLAANNPVALLLFSGGRTRPDSGEWSEAKTYHEIARATEFWIPDKLKTTRDGLAARTDLENFARDSFENVLFGICRFQQLVGSYPRTVTVASWAFKSARFDLHRAAIRFPAYRFRFVGVNDPLDLSDALNGERKALHSFSGDPFGSGADLSGKRLKRNPFDQVHTYRECPGMREFFTFMADPGNSEKPYGAQLPWEDPTG
ncbi:MAG: hypothetical protein L0241_30665 [Planctomycetia bacterium]|nr:hypothetical protein [Planctomycetia bacterium]